MADQHNSNIPAIGNTIAADIPDIKENLEFHKDAFQRIFKTWSDTDNSAAVFSTTPGFNDGTYAITFPTNAMAAAKFMLGNSNTITWFYLNTAPPGWKVYALAGDSLLAVAGGTTAYNVAGGALSSPATWTISGLTADAHTHTGPSHTHTGTTSLGGNWGFPSPGRAGDSGSSAPVDHNHTFTSGADGTGNTGAASATGVTSSGVWRPQAYVGKLFQLDTA
jgi:hypothetical protein